MYDHASNACFMTDALAVQAWQAYRLPEPIDDSLPLPSNTLHTTLTLSQTQVQHNSHPMYVCTKLTT